MNSETLFSMALGLQTPWQVKEVTFSTKERARFNLIKFMLRQAQHERYLSYKLLNLFGARS
jgi:hypothetical protein